MPPSIPFRELQTIFLDVGNTLVSMDLEWIARELDSVGVSIELPALRRAEARARPAVSDAHKDKGSTEGASLFSFYLRTMIAAALDGGHPSSADVDAVVEQLLPAFHGANREKLWTFVLPGVPEALGALSELGLQLVVASNSDGSVERVLTSVGLRPLLGPVFDSHLVGFEKPDPRFFQHALSESGASPSTTLHVGDLYAVDVLGARSADIHAALLDPYGDWADRDCVRFEDLTGLVRTLREAHNR